MSQQVTLRALDATLRAAFSAAGLTDAAVFNPASGPDVACEVYVDRAAQTLGFESQVAQSSITVSALREDLAALPKRGETFTVGAEVFTVDRVLDYDESRVVCVVKAGA